MAAEDLITALQSKLETMLAPINGGVGEDVSYDEVTLHAKSGDVFVFFSDGIVDASNAKDEQFGRSRVEHVIAKNADGSAREIVDAIFNAADEFAAGAEVFDDQTVVVLKVK